MTCARKKVILSTGSTYRTKMDPDLFAKVHLSYIESLRMLPEYIPFLKWRNTENETAVDIGCGTGRVTWEILRPLLPPGIQLVGSDINPKMLKYIAKNYPKLRTFELDIATENLPEHLRESFDHVFSFYTLMCVGNITQALQNIYDLLKPGGQFFAYYTASHVFFDTLLKLSKTEKWINYIPDVKKIFHYFEFDEINIQDVQKLFTDVGFKISTCKIDYKNFELSSMADVRTYVEGVSPDFSKLPPNLKEEFTTDVLEILLQHKIWIQENNDESSKVFVTHNLVTIHAMKC